MSSTRNEEDIYHVQQYGPKHIWPLPFWHLELFPFPLWQATEVGVGAAFAVLEVLEVFVLVASVVVPALVVMVAAVVVTALLVAEVVTAELLELLELVVVACTAAVLTVVVALVATTTAAVAVDEVDAVVEALDPVLIFLYTSALVFGSIPGIFIVFIY